MTSQRDIGQELLDGLCAIRNGEGRRFFIEIPYNVKGTRESLGLSQESFSSLMQISIKTLQDCEQGRRKPSGPACSLLRIAAHSPQAFLH